MEQLLSRIAMLSRRNEAIGINVRLLEIEHRVVAGAFTAASRKRFDQLQFILNAHTLPTQAEAPVTRPAWLISTKSIWLPGTHGECKGVVECGSGDAPTICPPFAHHRVLDPGVILMNQ
jgi:hypothetical protein